MARRFIQAASSRFKRSKKIGTCTDDVDWMIREVVVARSVQNVKSPDALISVAQFMRMPLSIWLSLMNLLSPRDLLNWAHAHPFFKDLITKSPKRWARIKPREAMNYDFHGHREGWEEAKAYKLTWSRFWWENEQKYILAYGDEYSFARDDFYYKGCDELHFVPLRPGVDREKVAVEDFLILFNNATFDQVAIGPKWDLPDLEKYNNRPSIRAHAVMLTCPTEEHYAQMLKFEPQCVALDVSNKPKVGALRSAVKTVMTMLPDLPKLWLVVGREVAEVTLLCDVPSPTIVAYFDVVGDYRRSRGDAPLVKKFERTLKPTLNTLIKQWQRRERDIDHIALISLRSSESEPVDWAEWKRVYPGICELPGELCKGKTDPYCIDWANEADEFWLIRRGPASHEGLLIGVKGPSFLLISCDYNFRRTRTKEASGKFFEASQQAQKNIKDAFVGDDPEVESNWRSRLPRRIITDRLAAVERAELAFKEWTKMEPHNSVPIRERAIDRLLFNSVYRHSCETSFTPTFEFDPPKDTLLGRYIWRRSFIIHDDEDDAEF
ncbi:unnamed protein product, partial [Mesorhabditis spiculigera]